MKYKDRDLITQWSTLCRYLYFKFFLRVQLSTKGMPTFLNQIQNWRCSLHYFLLRKKTVKIAFKNHGDYQENTLNYGKWVNTSILYLSKDSSWIRSLRIWLWWRKSWITFKVYLIKKKVISRRWRKSKTRRSPSFPQIQ